MRLAISWQLVSSLIREIGYRCDCLSRAFDAKVVSGATSLDSLSNPLAPGRPVMNPGKDWIGIDTSKLPPGSVVPDGVPGSAVTPPGHVSVCRISEGSSP
jgi:hypothetical protein